MMQYTGFDDVDGTEVYEGDILSDGENTFPVFFKDAQFCLKTSRGAYVGLKHFKDAGLRVIGNIYEDPEILGGENK